MIEDNAKRAITEILVNALINRDYIVLGNEIHIDKFDNHIKITSPGDMFDGAQFKNTIFTISVLCDETQ